MILLHLSDIHFGRNDPKYGIPDSFEKHDEILDGLLRAIEGLDPEFMPEHIVVTGDIAWNGKQNEFDEAKDWFRRLLSVTGLTGKDISFCVGNHDIDLSRKCRRERLDNGMVSRIDELYQYENLMISEPPLYAYNRFCSEMGMEPYIYPLGDGDEYSYSVGYKDIAFPSGKKLRLLSFNTSLLLGSGLSEDKMWLGQPQIKALIQNGVLPCTDEAWYTVALFHHSSRFLHPNETSSYDGRPATLTLLGSYADLLLCGHTESAGKPRLMKQRGGGNIFSAGAAYYSDTHANSFALIYISEEKKAMAILPYVYENGWKEYDYAENDIWPLLRQRKSHESGVQYGGELLLEADGEYFPIPLGQFRLLGGELLDNRMDIMSPFEVSWKRGEPVTLSLPDRKKRMVEDLLRFRNYQEWLQSHSASDVRFRILDSRGSVLASGTGCVLKKQLEYGTEILWKIIRIENAFHALFELPDKPEPRDENTINTLLALAENGHTCWPDPPRTHGELLDQRGLEKLMKRAEDNNLFYLCSRENITVPLFSTDVAFRGMTIMIGPYRADAEDLRRKLATLCPGDQRMALFEAVPGAKAYLVWDHERFWWLEKAIDEAQIFQIGTLRGFVEAHELTDTSGQEKNMTENSVKLTITIPSGERPLVEYGRHFNVHGEIEHSSPLPSDAILTVRLMSSQGQVLREVRQNRKNNRNLYLYHPDLTAYPDEMDPGRLGMLDYGFPELMVKDVERPMDSMRDATIKCWYSDDKYKALIVSATGVEQGRIFDDGVGFTDENGEPYPMLAMGDYRIEVELATADGDTLARAAKEIRIGRRTAQAIVRFNPWEHRLNMTKWCQDMNFGIINDVLPGYMEPYTGTWLYHMGLLPMYRSNDIALYNGVPIHMFVYLIDPTSTSYETELAYLQSRGTVGDPKMFHAYHYDIGEALVGSGRSYERRGKIVEFPEDEYLALCRVDVVNGKAKENCFNLNEEAVEKMLFDLDSVTVSAGDTIAVTGVVKPWQLDPGDFRLRPENIYDIGDSVQALHYEIDDGESVRTETRALLMERVDIHPIGSSVYEFYNLFYIDPSLRGKDLSLRITACDKRGEKSGASKKLTLRVK